MNRYNSTQLKFLYIMEYLVMRSDKEHPTNAAEIIKYLNSLGLKCERRSVYRVASSLNKFGIRIEKTKHTFYYVPTETDVFHVFVEKFPHQQTQS